MFAHHVGPLGDHPRTSVNFSRASRLRTVESCQAPPRAVRMRLAFKAAAIALGFVTPGEMIFAGKASALVRLVARTFSCASSKLVRLPSGSPRSFLRKQGGAGALGYQPALFLNKCSVDVQHEGIGVSTEFSNDEGHPLRREARDKRHVARQAAKLGYKHGAFALRACASSAASLGRRSMASAPLPVSTSTCSAMISKPSTAAKRAMASRCASRPSHHQVTDRALHFETP